MTACRCAELDWPREPVLPGQKGMIKVFYDSTTEPLGFREKVVDIIANTHPIVVEAKFSVNIVEG